QLFEQLAGDLAFISIALILELYGCKRYERKPFFRLDNGAAEPLDRFAIRRQVSSPFGLDVFEADAKEPVVDVVATQMSIAIRREDLENPFVQLENGNVERAAAQIINGYDPFFALVEAVGQRRRSGFVHQPQHVETGDAARVFGGLPLSV